MADRVRRPQNFDAFLQELTREQGIFKTYKDALVFAACLGFSRDKRVSFDKSSEPINLQVFGAHFDQMVINVLAVANEGDPFIMSDEREDEKIRLFEEYACGGLEIMHNEVGQGPLRMDEGLLKMVLAEQEDTNILMEITELAER